MYISRLKISFDRNPEKIVMSGLYISNRRTEEVFSCEGIIENPTKNIVEGIKKIIDRGDIEEIKTGEKIILSGCKFIDYDSLTGQFKFSATQKREQK